MNNIINWINNNASIPLLIVFFVGSLLLIGVSVWMIKICVEFVKLTGRKSFTPVKVVIAGIAPSVFFVLGILDKDIPVGILVAAEIAICIGVIIWNIIYAGPIMGLMFSFLHICGGLMMGLAAGSIVFVAIFAVGMLIAGGASSGSGSSGGMPEYVVDENTGESYYVQTGANGVGYLPARGGAILRPSDYAGRYIDDNGNSYIVR